MTGVGDYNNDGKEDLLVGTLEDHHAYLFYGGSPPDSTALPDVSLFGGLGTNFGRRVFGGDIDGNGIGDFAVSDPNANSGEGAVYVYLGSSSGWTGDANDPQGSADITFVGNTSAARIGHNVAMGQDITGDGDPDFVLGVGAGTNKVYIYEGPLSASATDIELADADVEISGFSGAIRTGDGERMTIREDITGNLINDLLVVDDDAGAKGRVVLIEGGAHLSSQSSLTLAELADHRRFFKISSLSSTDNFGSAIAAIPGDNPGVLSAGRISVAAPDASAATTYSFDMGSPGRLPTSGGGASVFRQKGDVAQDQNYNYEGTPVAGLMFDYTQSTGAQREFVSLSDNFGRLFSSSAINVSTAIADFSNDSGVGGSGDFAGADDAPQSALRGVAAADFDNDGDIDFAVAAPAGTSSNNGFRLYQNTSGEFEDISDDVLITGGATSLKASYERVTAVSWADSDLDGQVDLLLTLTDSSGDGLPPVLLRNRYVVDGQFEDVSSSEGVEITSDPGILSWAHAWGDADGDGDLDLFIGEDASASSPSHRLYRNDINTGGGFTPITLGTAPTGGVQSATWADIDDDGDFDIVIANSNSTSKPIIQNAGSWSFAATGQIGVTDPSWALPEDLDYDGVRDILVASATSTRQLRAFRAAKHPASGVFGFSDYGTQNGLRDVLGGTFALLDDLAGASSTRDGDLELLSGQYIASSTSDVPTLLMQQVVLDPDETLSDISSTLDLEAENHWVGFIMEGAGGNNISGIGTKLTAYHTNPLGESVAQIGFVDGGSLRGSQRSAVVRFGLGAATALDSLIVEWPDGWVQKPTVSGIDQVHSIVDSSDPEPYGEAFSYEVAPDDTANWIFEWDSATAGWIQNSRVTVEWVSGGGSCYFPTTTLSPTSADVTYTMEPVFSGGSLTNYHHTLIWNRE